MGLDADPSDLARRVRTGEDSQPPISVRIAATLLADSRRLGR
jgi:hypothetical protein